MDRKGEGRKNSVIPDRMMHFLWGLVILSALFCMLIFFIPLEALDMYHLLSNSFEIGIALACMVSCLYAYRTGSERIIVLLAAFAFGGYALSNTFWYLYSNMFTIKDEFFSIAELGFLGVMLFFIVAFRIEFSKKPYPPSLRIGSAGLFLILALITLAISGITQNSVLSIFWLVMITLFIDTALDHGIYRYPLLWQGICLWCFTSVMYGLWYNVMSRFVNGTVRIPSAPNLLTWGDFFNTIVGPLFFLSLLLFQLGIFEYLNSSET